MIISSRIGFLRDFIHGAFYLLVQMSALMRIVNMPARKRNNSGANDNSQDYRERRFSNTDIIGASITKQIAFGITGYHKGSDYLG